MIFPKMNMGMGPTLGAGAAAAGVTTLVFDTFTDSDSTAISAHTPEIDTVGGGWTIVGGTPDISSNRVQAKAGDIATIDAGAADVTISAIANGSASNSAPYVLFRQQDANNYWRVRLRVSDDDFAIQDIVGGSGTTRASTSVTIDAATDYDVEVVLSGSNIDATIDGANDINYSSATFAAETEHGFLSSGNTSRFDDFTITE